MESHQVFVCECLWVRMCVGVCMFTDTAKRFEAISCNQGFLLRLDSRLSFPFSWFSLFFHETFWLNGFGGSRLSKPMLCSFEIKSFRLLLRPKANACLSRKSWIQMSLLKSFCDTDGLMLSSLVWDSPNFWSGSLVSALSCFRLSRQLSNLW